MMGATVPSSGEFGSFFEMLGLLGDKDKFEGKLKELVAAAETSKRTLEQAAENNRKAEETQKIAQEMLTAANLKVEDANRRVVEATKLIDGVSHKERELQAREIALETKHTEMLNEVAAQRAALDLANKAAVAELDHSNANFITEQQAIAAKIEARWHAAADKEAVVNKREDELKKLLAENNDAKDLMSAKMHELDEKLAKLKAIAGA